MPLDSGVDVQIHGFDELAAALQKMPGEIARKHLQKAVYAGAVVVRNEAKARASRSSGQLASQGIIARVDRKTDWYTKKYQIGLHRKYGWYGRFLEFGTSPHEISARYYQKVRRIGSGRVKGRNTKVFTRRGSGARALHFGYGAGSMGRYAVRVQHPGIKPRPFLRPAFDNNTSQIIAAIGRQLGKGIEDYANKQRIMRNLRLPS